MSISCKDIEYLRLTNEVAKRSISNKNHPFGAVLVGPDGELLMQQKNIERQERGTGHAEAALVRRAVIEYSPDFLNGCTLYTSVEPCVMCSGCVYWGNIGRVVYGVAESSLLNLTGDHDDNPTMSLPCREVFQHGQKDIDVAGPFAAVEDEILTLHREYWN